MSLGDFLRKKARTPFEERFLLGGVTCAISTNVQSILDAARASFTQADNPSQEPGLRLRFWVDGKGKTKPPWPKPFFRGLGNLIFAGFDSESALVIDLGSCRAFGRFSPAMGADETYWKTVILPSLVSIVGAAVGITELHCACVARGENGLLLAGSSGSGKSTLALTLARAGFGYVSDDRTYCSKWDGRLLAWGLPTRLKLRPSSAELLQDFRGREPTIAPNGEPAFQIDPDCQPDFDRVRQCRPRSIVFLERQEEEGFELEPLSAAEASLRLEQGLIAQTPEGLSLQRQAIAGLAALPCWRLRYLARPQAVACELARRFDNELSRGFRGNCTGHSVVQEGALRSPVSEDPLRRFTPTQLASTLAVMGRSIRFETDSPLMLERAQAVFARYRGESLPETDFVWRIVCEAGVQKTARWPQISAFSDGGLRFVNIGQRSFFAIDLERRTAVGYLGKGLIEDERGFVSPFLSTLFCLTSGPLRLTPLAAACVRMGDKGLLVLGRPNNGKTTSSYLAAALGLEFYSDRAVFLDFDHGVLRAWADFSPAAFRMGTTEFHPELKTLGHAFHCFDCSFLYLEESTAIRSNGKPVIPAACVFLERGAAKTPQLKPLHPEESNERLAEYLPFQDEECFEEQHSRALSALAQVPALSLAYGEDPAEAAEFFPSLLVDPHRLSASR
ncbi:MAG: hypothetical protein J2P13_01550 [Acidobacteria bacterium]|nr:hypothetical protein [Acidobacteriota bacterium]